MSKYRVTFIYGLWHLWTDVERAAIKDDDRRGFADLAQIAVNVALESMPSIEQKHVAHDYAIFELTQPTSGEPKATLIYAFDTLKNE